MVTMPSTKRLAIETKRLRDEPLPGITAVPKEDNPRYFDVILFGPQSSPYEGGIFKLELFCDKDYPLTPPKVRFLTKIYHPNVDRIGRICLSILKENVDGGWSAALQIGKVLLSIQALMSAPNVDDPLDTTVAENFKRNQKEAEAKARQWTAMYAV
eukprot:TRINITY_DN681_c0_g1_i1.p2 TRINITY_DN681_c0_g1~~TRINITY_DN681_c0_g1_i1.p2  ORF type:complete len:156 (+),score=36.38 TRINITY_DN681_c0_g1_i1:305-772(+)